MELIDRAGYAFTTLRNATGQLTQIAGGDNAAYSFSYNGAGDLTRIVSPDGTSSVMTYDPLFHRLTSFTDANGDETAFTFDSKGRPITTTYADGTSEHITYDAIGHALTFLNANAQIISGTYDSGGNLTSITFPDLPAQTLTYDGAGYLASIADSTGVINVTHDAGGRITHIDYPDGTFVNYRTTARAATRINDSTGAETNYSYGTNGQLSEIRDVSDTLIVAYTYDTAGRLTRSDFYNGTATTYAYDTLGQLTRVTNLAPDNSTQSFSQYTYDAAGHRASLTNNDGVTTFGYDLKGQLTSVTLPSARVITYAYDGVGNRITVTDNGVATAYSANDVDEYTGAGAKTFTYDAAGNTTSVTEGGVTTHFSYDSLGRISAAINPAHNITYGYDALNQLASYTDNGTTHRLLHDPTGTGRVIAEFDGTGALVSRYLYSRDGVVAQLSPGGEFRAYGFDGSGNVVQLTDGSGAVVDSYSYLPFGEILAANESVANPYKFVGQHGVLDVGRGAVRRRGARVRLDHRALHQPRSASSIGLNPYTYAENQPTDKMDFTGFDAYTETISNGRTLPPPTPPPPAPSWPTRFRACKTDWTPRTMQRLTP